MGCRFLLWGISPTRGVKPEPLHLLHWQVDFFFFFFLLLSQLGNRLTTGLPEKSCVPVQTFNSSIYESSVCGPRLLDFVSVCCSAGRIWLGLRQGDSEGVLSETLRSWLF